jgi:hypothetical protein
MELSEPSQIELDQEGVPDTRRRIRIRKESGTSFQKQRKKFPNEM